MYKSTSILLISLMLKFWFGGTETLLGVATGLIRDLASAELLPMQSVAPWDLFYEDCIS